MSETINVNRYTCREALLEFAGSVHPGVYIRAVGCPADFLSAVATAHKFGASRDFGVWYAMYGGNLLSALAVAVLDDDVIEDLSLLHGTELERVATDKISAALGITLEQRSEFFLRERLSDEFEERLVAGKITLQDAADVISWLSKTGEVGWEITAPKPKCGEAMAVYDVLALNGEGLSRTQNGFKEAHAQQVSDDVTRLLARTEHLFNWRTEPHGYGVNLLIMDAGDTDPHWHHTMRPLTHSQALDRVREEGKCKLLDDPTRMNFPRAQGAGRRKRPRTPSLAWPASIARANRSIRSYRLRGPTACSRGDGTQTTVPSTHGSR